MDATSKDTLLGLDHETRAFALVGRFMSHFALLEAGINTALGNVLELQSLQQVVVTRNMAFDEKIKTLRTLVRITILDPVEAKRFDALAIRARKLGETRNVVAHTPFRASPTSDGVEFLRANRRRRNMKVWKSPLHHETI
ncbi:hypothetical protein RJJ65_07005 [Rhizobium hidalgonense]|uniref:Uncharacterized protein n=1 Tax=Rhizobium hidalgonense TaxID=1538159 RepID=A0A2A6K3H7_9HYPH|nr:hypothetical protein [Rhizobium hidalgonense]MDR9772406.1 hypothetical protein [Rhizobium hidalgonense]MDR9811407.1 hypothetical protein [Rhizobium hidalgonense]MDR9821529.1 hypothetical protein [Rhizobium hidalgonense]PDT19002.1 hypothetical protein CO674_35670 [Rhizobium hidalgonense]PON03008.1 hypothetical protein ATY29_32050 [Rhizobium hidalgonense]